MEYRLLGHSGVQVSPLCLGTMNFGGPTPEDEAIYLIDKALDAGINFIDTANSYNGGESERIVGKALTQNSWRNRVILATKVYNSVSSTQEPNERELSRYHILNACEASLRRLQTDYIDLYQLHRPSEYVPHEETLRALDDLVTAGKVRYIGTTTFPAWTIMEGLALSEKYRWVRYVSEQPPYNLLDRRVENETIPLAQKYNLAILPWSPIAMGILAGKYLPGASAPAGSRLANGRNMMDRRVNERGRQIGAQMVKLAQARGITASQLALLWLKDQPGVTAPIIGPRTLAHLNDALPVLEMTFSTRDRALFDDLVHPGTAVADFHSTAWWMKARF
jgi:aryl-alcohol dehydrogenase-like predicted oxidoreductase